MNNQSNAVPNQPFEPQALAPAAASEIRPAYWSVRRELWENRSVYVAPLAAGAVYLLGYLIGLIWLPRSVRALSVLDAAHQRIKLAELYAHAGMLIMAIAFVTGIFYSLDSLYSERRDRSILFWKSLPVSDLTTVLSKASIPLLIMPALVLAIAISLQLIMWLLSSAVLQLSGVGAAALWNRLPLFEMEFVLLYGVIVITLWHAPIYCWMMLVSSSARRATFLWAVLPPAAIAVFEWIAFRTSYIGSLLRDRLFGFAEAAFDLKDKNGVEIDAHLIPLTQLAPGRFFSSPGLWLGLVVAAIFLVAAIRLRRYQGPI
jgi:ABC-2 type transport system permease protein